MSAKYESNLFDYFDCWDTHIDEKRVDKND